MLSWFNQLSPGEKCAALAIVEDPIFIRFYISLLREENKQRQLPESHHALFNKEVLVRYYEHAKLTLSHNKKSSHNHNNGNKQKKSSSSNNNDNNNNSSMLPSSSSSYTFHDDPNTLSRDPFNPRHVDLSTGNSAYDTGEFDDPFYSPITPNPISIHHLDHHNNMFSHKYLQNILGDNKGARKLTFDHEN